MDAVDTYLRSPEQPLITKNWRFLGFINDVGEALRSFLPKSLYVRGLRGVAWVRARGCRGWVRGRVHRVPHLHQQRRV